MLYCALASDYDGTLAHDGNVDAATVHALEQFKATGKRLILITGRELKDLLEVFQAVRLFDVVVAENGAVLYLPAAQEERALAASPPHDFVAALRAKGVDPLSIGRSIVATWTPNERVVMEVIRELGLDWQLTFNKGAVMCLPPGVNKGSGLAAALDELKLSPHNVAGIGDAENDQAFLSVCGCSVAVANAIHPVKERADVCTAAARGAGVAEFISSWLTDPAALFSSVRKHDIRIGDSKSDGCAQMLPSEQGAALIAGASGGGKTGLTHLLLERMAAGHYQVCVVDPEGDYDTLEHATHLGDANHAPTPEEVLSVLDAPRASMTVNLLGIEVAERPAYFSQLMGQIIGLRAATGRPHWLILDEAHHLVPSTQNREHTAVPENLSSAVLITTHPRNLSQSALRAAGLVVGVGAEAVQVLEEFASAARKPLSPAPSAPQEDAVLVWNVAGCKAPQEVTVEQAKRAHRRHTRKYAEGRLGEDKSFYFRGRAGALNLRAYNLATFLQLAAGVDDATWLYHLKRGDYTAWFREAIKDEPAGRGGAATKIRSRGRRVVPPNRDRDSLYRSPERGAGLKEVLSAISLRYMLVKPSNAGVPMTLALHVFPPSPRSFKVLLAAEHFKVPYEMKLVNLGTGEQKSQALSQLNLNQRVPVLVDGDYALWESNAILEYLASVALDGKFLPTDTKARLQITKWLYWESSHWDAACAVLIFERVVKRRFKLGEESVQEIERGNTLFKRLAPVLNEQLSRHAFICGDEITLADLAMVAPLCVSEQARLPIADMPAIQAWLSRLRALPAWQAASKLQTLV